ncbi:hypothetical protein ANCCAN_04433 [Ancylostoma caninum]|uniref:Rabaptin GTPase-Rab5 binding domain-containing protein n=1 Tax=Ancylostoma caninum TaxID=29170 RepID=A0A368GYQ9_ANCCA|nr:hypothetical protein ANCCAN_04433 [Ancylostoma caninum]
MTAQNYKARCASLQSELDTSEAVQKDFVQLSQSLQIQLEKIRQSEQEVRWQWEEDVENCSGCGVSVVKIKPRPRYAFCVYTVVKYFAHHVYSILFPVDQIADLQTFVTSVILCLIGIVFEFVGDSKPFFAVDPTN